MPDPYPVKPDRDFLHRIIGDGGEDLKSCFQCATCSVVCELSNGRKPFPRKEMIWAQWGLRDRLIADPDAWLCYQCNDCSTHCPRGARPGDVMAAIRRESVLHFAVPGFLGRWVSQLKYLPLVLLIPAVLLGLAMLLKDPVENALGIADYTGGKIVYSFSTHFPHWLLISFFSFFSLLTLLAVVAGVMRFWKALKATGERSGITAPAKGLGASIVAALKRVVLHDNFDVCSTDRSRLLSHLGVFYGFLALSLVAVWVVTIRVNPLVGGDFVYPFNFFSPWRILANLGGIALSAGCAWMIWERIKKRGQGNGGSFSDWNFVATLLAVALSGLVTEAMHYARLEPHRHFVYFIHLVLVFALLMYLPYSKFAHLVYRTTAMVYAEYAGLNVAAAEPPAPAPAAQPEAEKEEPQQTEESTDRAEKSEE